MSKSPPYALGGLYDQCALFLSWSVMYNKMSDTLYIGEFMAIRYIRGFSKLAGKTIKQTIFLNRLVNN